MNNDTEILFGYLEIYDSSSAVVYGTVSAVCSFTVLFIMMKNDKLRKSFFMFFLLAWSNFFYSVGFILLGIVELYQAFHPFLRNTDACFCLVRLYPLLISLSKIACSTINMLMCLERLVAVAFPSWYAHKPENQRRQLVASVLLIFVGSSAIGASISSCSPKKSPALWVCNPHSVFRFTFIQFRDYFRVAGEALSAIFMLIAMYLFRRAKTNAGGRKPKRAELALTKMVGVNTVLSLIFGFVPDVLYAAFDTVQEAYDGTTAVGIYIALYQKLPLANMCALLIVHCWQIKEFRLALLCISSTSRQFQSSAVVRTNI